MSGYSLDLADGTKWTIQAEDDEAERVVSAFAGAMGLKPGDGFGRVLRVLTLKDSGFHNIPVPTGDVEPVDLFVYPSNSGDMFAIQMTRLAQTIARFVQPRGSILVHGALAELSISSDDSAERPGKDVILAGPGQVGKSTASSRLPPPWRSLCDDATLVVRDDDGKYWAHPWPTWSLFFEDGPGGSWDVQRAVPLHDIFFMAQSPEDSATSINTEEATAMLMASVQQVTGSMKRKLEEKEVHALYLEQLAAVTGLARTIPVHTLRISLTGMFWKVIEQVLSDNTGESGIIQPGAATVVTTGAVAGAAPSGMEEVLGDTRIPVRYTGPSMKPTLREPDLMEVEPYGSRPIRCGDVVYFRPPGGGIEVVHRVIRVTPEGIITCGDNNRENDTDILQPSDIRGRVVAAQRYQRRRRIAGGWQGHFMGQWYRFRRRPSVFRTRRIVNRSRGRIMRGTYRILAGTGILHRITPSGLKPRLVLFQTRHQKFLKLISRGRVVGQYDTRDEKWHIRRRYRLFVDESTLPRPGKDHGSPPIKSTPPKNTIDATSTPPDPGQ